MIKKIHGAVLDFYFPREEGEQVPVEDQLWFFGVNGGGIVVALIYLTLLLT